MKYAGIALALSLAFCAAAHAEGPLVHCFVPAQGNAFFDEKGELRLALFDPITRLRMQLEMSPVDWQQDQSEKKERALRLTQVPQPATGPKAEDRIKVVEIEVKTRDKNDPAASQRVQTESSSKYYRVNLLDANGNPVAYAQGGPVSTGVFAGRIQVGSSYSADGRLDVSGYPVVAHDNHYVVAARAVADGTRVSLMVDQSTRVGQSIWGLGYATGVGGGVSLTSQQGQRSARFSLSAAPAVTNAHGYGSVMPILGANLELSIE